MKPLAIPFSLYNPTVNVLAISFNFVGNSMQRYFIVLTIGNNVVFVIKHHLANVS